MLVIVDYGCGNLLSLARACAAAEIQATVSGAWRDVARASALILPGVGAFPRAMQALIDHNLVGPILSHVERGKLLIGICLGHQLLMEQSLEGGRPGSSGTHGLQLLRGGCAKLPPIGVPVPHVGWHPVRPPAGRNGADTTWAYTPLAATAPNERFYFSHSYRVYPEDPRDWLAVTDFGPHHNPVDVGESSYPAAIGRDNVFGLQFHPEKSAGAGLRVFQQIKRMMERL